MDLQFLRDYSGKEIGFIVKKESKPLFAVECKSGAKSISSAFKYYKDRLPINDFYQVHMEETYYQKDNIIVCPFWKFCELKNLV